MTSDPHRRLVQVSVASICKETGFNNVTKSSLETLTELLQAHLTELTKSCRKFAELGQRTTPDLSDIKMALAEVGSSPYGLHLYSKRVPSKPVKKLTSVKPIPEHKTLKPSLAKPNLPSYIPNHFPDFPDTHSFVRTPTIREPINQYHIVRERIANQRQTSEESFVKFFSHSTESPVQLFENIDSESYPAINIEGDPYLYLKCICLPNCENVAENEKADKSLDDSEIEKDSQRSQLRQVSQLSNSRESSYLQEPKKIKSKR